jgi:hypothetical protein
VSARDRIAADLAAVCRRLDEHERDGTPPRAGDIEAIWQIGEAAAASGGRRALNQLAWIAARKYAPAAKRLAAEWRPGRLSMWV